MLTRLVCQFQKVDKVIDSDILKFTRKRKMILAPAKGSIPLLVYSAWVCFSLTFGLHILCNSSRIKASGPS